MLRSMEDEDWFSHDAMTTWGFNWFLSSILGPLRRVLAEGSHLYWFTDWRMTPTIYGMLEAHGYRVNHCLVWAKTHFGMGSYWRNQHENIVFASAGQPTQMLDRGMGSVITSRGVSPIAREHPTEKPLELITTLMRAVPGDVILDPFMGSGTTLRAAKDLGRKAIGIEIEERYCEIAVQRLAQGVLSFDSA
jgi:site-specific DNA-methyltransferase (adenine-specific)